MRELIATHPHGELSRTIQSWHTPDPFNNVGRWCDLDRNGRDMMRNLVGPDSSRAWSVRGYRGQYECGCYVYTVTHENLPSGITVAIIFGNGRMRDSSYCAHTTVTNLY